MSNPARVPIDHKTVALRTAITALAFLLVGFALVALMRWQLAWPGRPLPVIGALLGDTRMPGGIMLPEFYNQLGALHGTIMVFLGIVPLAVGGFGGYLVPLMIGARQVAFPRLNAVGYVCYLVGGLVMLGSLLAPGGGPAAGWTSYAPLANIASDGQTWWLVGMVFIIAAAFCGAMNMIVTIVQLRAPGMYWFRLPFFVWTQLVTAFLLLLAFPPLLGAALLQLSDRLLGSSFFLPSGLVVGGKVLAGSGGGNPVLWQHLFWFLAHPEVYVLVLPALGIVAEIIAINTRKPLWGYRSMAVASLFLGVMSMLVWAHHMFLTGMGTAMSVFFQATTLIVSVPSVVILTGLLLSLWGGSIRFSVPMLFALGFLPMFAMGGLTGLPLGLGPADIHLHDTYYVIGHFHYIVAPGTLLALFGGIYHWFPKVTGRRLHDGLARLHFWGTLVFMNGVFFPMFLVGLAGVSRRLYDGGASYLHAQPVLHWNGFMSVSAWLLGVAQLPFLWNLVMTLRRRPDAAAENPWQATTLEWAAPTPPPAGNFVVPVTVFHGPYEYSVPGGARDFQPQGEA